MTNPILDTTMRAIAPLIGRDSVHRVADQPAPAMKDGGMVASFKGSGYLGADDQPAGSSLNPQAQLGLFVKIRQKGGWARFVTFRPVSETSGHLDLWDDSSFKMFATAGEGPRTNIPLNRPDLTNRQYSCKTVSGAFGLRLKAIKAAAKAGQDANALVQQGIAAGIANTLMDLGVNGDTALPADSDTNKMRRAVDGWWKKIRTDARNYTSKADGFPYHNKIWAGMLQQIDEGYRADPGLAWGLSDVLGTRWLTELTATAASPANAHPSIINDFGAALLNAMGNGAKPLGREGIVLPQIATDGYGTEGYSGVAPTSITNNGDGTLTINVNALCDSGVDRSSTGADGQRYVTVGCKSTGKEETIAVAFATPNNTVTTTTLLGQGTPSTTAADYYVKYADQTSLFLGVFRHLVCVVQNGMRIYTVFYPRDEVIEVIVHTDLDYMVVDFDSMALAETIIAPRFNVLP